MTTQRMTDATQREELARRAAWDAASHTDSERTAEEKRRMEWDHGVGTTAATPVEAGAVTVANNIALLLNDIGSGMSAPNAERVKNNIRVELDRLRAWGTNPDLPLAPTPRDDSARLAAAREEGARTESRRRDAARDAGSSPNVPRTPRTAHSQAEKDEEARRRKAWDNSRSTHTSEEIRAEEERRAAWDRA